MASNEGASIFTKSYVKSIKKNDKNGYDVHLDYLGDPKVIECRIVIGADGVDSRVGRWAGIKTQVKMKDMESCIQYSVGNIDLDVNRMDMYVGTNYAPGGYLWVFPKGDGHANIGIGVSGKYSKEKSAKSFLDEFIDREYPGATIHTTMCGGVPCAKPIKNTVIYVKLLLFSCIRFV